MSRITTASPRFDLRYVTLLGAAALSAAALFAGPAHATGSTSASKTRPASTG